MLDLINLKNRLGLNNDRFQHYNSNQTGLSNLQARLNVRGGVDQWTRMRQDKLRSLKKTLLYSYQSAIVQKYNVQTGTLIENLLLIISILQNNNIKLLTEEQLNILAEVEEQYNFSILDRTSLDYIIQLQEIINILKNQQPFFRCLINHDKLKVEYQDKIISIPFFDIPVNGTEPINTNFHNGTVFKWIHGNKEEWTPDTYWIVYMQYSEETAYFRAQIRKADQEIEILTIDDEGNETTSYYRGWMTGPNQTAIIWNIKKNVTWNDMNYTKILYITKDQNTSIFFKRFDRVIINGVPWQVQAYNENYSTDKTGENDFGIIRVALKETYTSSNQFINQTIKKIEQKKEAQAEYDLQHTETRIDGPTTVKPYSQVTFIAKNFDMAAEWTLYDTPLARIKTISEDRKTVIVEILTGTSNKNGFYINYGNSEETKVHVIIGSL